MGLIAGVLAMVVFGAIFYTRAIIFADLLAGYFGPLPGFVVFSFSTLFVITGLLIGWGLGFKLAPF